jgi:AAA domain, putative AbiEii toxin, Type IV TA system
MRFVSVETSNIGGLTDGTTPLPEAPIVALAGSNGSGKSRFLSCLKVPWTRQIPSAADMTRESFVEVTVTFSEQERHAQVEFARQRRNAAENSFETMAVRVSHTPMGGIAATMNPPEAYLVGEMFTSQDVLQVFPSLDFVYIPAERRLTTQQNAFTLVSIKPEDNVRSSAALRSSYEYAGGMDDYEFEDYARTLCIAAYLPDESGEVNETASKAWDRFTKAVNGVLAPKRLLPLTQEEPSNLRIALPDGKSHGLEGLSSGERQALIVISRIFRAGEGHTMVAIDEPDAYLHPSLSAKLLQALRLGLPGGSGLIIATHSPAILDSIDPQSILRFQHNEDPRIVVDEAERIDLYRSAGFRASALTQSDLLLITEGNTDGEVLRDLIPELVSSTIRSPGGRDLVFRDVAALQGLNLPILGVVDADVLATAPPSTISKNCFVWPAADIEGLLLSQDSFILAALEARLFKPEFDSLKKVRALLDHSVNTFEKLTTTEFAIRTLRIGSTKEWPSPRDQQVREKLEQLLAQSTQSPDRLIDAAFREAAAAWANKKISKWKLVRGKYVLQTTLAELSVVKTSEAFVRAALVSQPVIPAIEELRAAVIERLGGAARK